MKSIWMVLTILLLFAGTGFAKTPDGLTPSTETVCDEAGLTGAAWGLCNAYCEAMDCDSENPKASAQGCETVGENFIKKSGMLVIPCEDDIFEVECPCFSEADILSARALADQVTSQPERCPFIDASGIELYRYDDLEELLYNADVVNVPGEMSCSWMDNTVAPPVAVTWDTDPEQTEACMAILLELCGTN